MNHFRTPLCAICGQERSANQPRFLIAENTWEDKLTILQWSEHLASWAGLQVACSIDHVEELVIHWMTTGRLDFPFARTALGAASWRPILPPGGRVDISGARLVGELAVHRESVERLLIENPRSLQAILDALLDALRQEIAVEVAPVSLRAAEGKRRRRKRVVRGFARAGILAECQNSRASELRTSELGCFSPGAPVSGNRIGHAPGRNQQPAWLQTIEVLANLLHRRPTAQVDIRGFPSHGKQQPKLLATLGQDTQLDTTAVG